MDGMGCFTLTVGHHLLRTRTSHRQSFHTQHPLVDRWPLLASGWRRRNHAVVRKPYEPKCGILLVAGTHGQEASREMRSNSTRSFSSEVRDSRRDPVSNKIQLDFFGEPVTFLTASSSDDTTKAMAALDGFLLAVVSKGKTCTDGGDEAGLQIKSIHSAAINWAELLRYAAIWNSEDDSNEKSAPMLAYVAVAPLLANAGAAYLQNLDALLLKARPGAPGLPLIQLLDMATRAVKAKSNPFMNRREQLHLEALEALLKDDHASALATMLRILRLCPGDTLALSLAMDLSQLRGDKDAALRAAGTVSQYWNERSGGLIRPAMPGHPMASSLMALGFAVGGRHEEAERIASIAMKKGKKVAGGLATWAQAHVFDASGRVAEGISALANYDGVTNYAGCGFLHFDCRLAGYGARFHLDREERGRGKSKALRLYEENFDRVLGYSGFDQGKPWEEPRRKAPLSWREVERISDGDEKPKSFLSRLFKHDEDGAQETQQYEIISQKSSTPSLNLDNMDPSVEDVLTWIPPTPLFLSEATMLLLRLTLNGSISRKHPRWDNLRKAWESTLSIQRKYGRSLIFSPSSALTASLLLPPSKTGADRMGSNIFAQGLYLFGKKLQLGNMTMNNEEQTSALLDITAVREPDFWLPAKESDAKNEWKLIVDCLATTIDGFDFRGAPSQMFDSKLQFCAWNFDARPILEHVVVYSACKAGDTESLCLARSICSAGVTLRPNSPEEWWRYSIVLGLLGDEVASEDALNYSINLGGGQGARAA